MILVYSEKSTSRLKYTLDLIFREVLEYPYTLTDDLNIFLQALAIKINYSDRKIEKILQISPSGLLDEIGIKQQKIKMGSWKNIPVLFANDNPDLNFDLFSAVFYLVARYEEYLAYNPDIHGRFEADQCLAWKYKFLHLPVIDLWCKQLAEELGIEKQCSGVQPENYRFQLTIDVDQAWTVKNQNGFHIAGSLIKRLLNLDFHGFNQQIRIITGSKNDPADNFNFLEKIEKKLPGGIKFFFLFANRSKFDNNNPPKNKNFQKLILSVAAKNKLGIHPSYASNNSFQILENEYKDLSGVIQEKIKISRQHFLKLKIPETYRNLINIGIEEDYTMGFGSQTGFRAGIARPFNFYDLQLEAPTKLRLFPFEVMDRTLLTYINYTPEQAIREFNLYTKTIKNVGGMFVPLWHNTSLGEYGEWKGWKPVFEEMIKLNTNEESKGLYEIRASKKI